MEFESPLSLLDIFESVLPFFDNDEKKTAIWMLTENVHLGNISPIDLWNLGSGKKLIKFIENQLNENEM
jgi:hypothetical protein